MTRCLALAAAALLAAGPASGQSTSRRGSHELAVHVSPDFESAIGDRIDVRIGYGVFVRDRLSLRALFGWEVLEDVAGEDSDYRSSELFVAAELHFGRSSRLVPYLGAGVGWQRTRFGPLDASGVVAGPVAGLEVFLADNVALDLGLRYRLGSADVFVNDFVAEDSDLSALIGLRVLLFRRGTP